MTFLGKRLHIDGQPMKQILDLVEKGNNHDHSSPSQLHHHRISQRTSLCGVQLGGNSSHDNEAAGLGGAIYLDGCDMTLEGGHLFTANSAATGGAIAGVADSS